MIQGDVSSSDMIFGAVVLAVALPVFYGIGRIVNRFQNRRFERAWRPLMPLLGGAKVVAEPGAAASSWLTGTYRGATVRAEMTPDVGHSSAIEMAGYENRFETGLRDIKGAADWSVAWKEAILGFGTTGWTIWAADSALEARLHGAGIREVVAPLGRGSIEYSARSATLVLHQDIRPLWAPGPVRFQFELDVLLELAAVTAPLNRG
jgi:hypothetical protein